ncbi:MAG: aminoglycoside phosphotransferase family protein, partial [Ruminococcus sp.]|nr:aminoglycoside phosphotransferase family protein [Ruminococcus sp.]
INNIPEYFNIKDVHKISPINTGHINKTYLIETGAGKYIMQSLNRNVFRKPHIVMENISRIETAFRRSVQDIITVPHYLTADGKYYVEVDNEVWRIYEYAERSDLPVNKDYLTGYAFGRYIDIINDDVILDNTIENFHNFEMYYNRLPDGTEKYFDGLRSRLEIFGDIPERNVHNDAKTDNIIFGQKITVIDLDTSMRGHVAIDYGDMIRSAGTENIAEITRGFADGLDGLLTPAETDSLYYGILYVTGELAMRYIIDSVSERRYFTTKTPEQCRRRAEDLLKQLEFFENNSGMKNIIRQAF